MRTEAAKAAAEIRKTLKENNITARITSKTYSMGSSVTVRVVDQAPWVIEAMKIALDKYEYGTFDGMTDCAGIKNSDFDGPQAKHVFINNIMSDSIRDKIWTMLKSGYAAYENAPEEYDYNFRDGDGEYASQVVHRVFCDQFGHYGFWNKPKVRLAA